MRDRGNSIILAVPESFEPDPLIADIREAFPTAHEQVLPTTRTWFDTFDWRLYRRGFYLYCGENGWRLLQKGTPEAVGTMTPEENQNFLFAWDFPAGRIRSVLEPVLEMRRLIPLVTIETSANSLRILNRDDKTVSLVNLETHRVFGMGLIRTVRLGKIRGYVRNFKQLAGFFSNYGIVDRVDEFYPVSRGVEFTGRKPLDYSSAFKIALKPDDSARTAMTAIYSQLLGVMQRNEAGVLDDLDSEFLHDFRVAVRRTRSGLGQVKDVLPEQITAKARKDFSWLGRITGPSRDLDVYLLYERNYRGRLPAHLQKGLDVFFADMRVSREAERAKLVRHMRSEKYRRILADWNEYLSAGTENQVTACSEKPVIELAREIIFRKYKKIIRDGKGISPSSPDKNLHRLRIDCKKLRYVLEFFSSLFGQDEIRQAVKLLKRLQNNLGDFNDLSVQQDMLREYLASLRPGSRKKQELAAALGGLLTNLYHEQQRVRQKFAVRFSEFSARKNEVLYRKLFHQKT